MTNPPFTLAEVQSSLAKGFDWQTRVDVLCGAIEWFLDEVAPPGELYGNYQLCEALLGALGCLNPRRTPEFRALSQFVSRAGKMKQMKAYVVPGPEQKFVIKGEPRMIRTRLWRRAAEIVEASDGAPIEAPATEAEEIYGAVRRLQHLGYVVLPPGEANNVDNSEFSPHPIAGQKPLTCHHCNGGGKVWRKA